MCKVYSASQCFPFKKSLGNFMHFVQAKCIKFQKVFIHYYANHLYFTHFCLKYLKCLFLAYMLQEKQKILFNPNVNLDFFIHRVRSRIHQEVAVARKEPVKQTKKTTLVTWFAKYLHQRWRPPATRC